MSARFIEYFSELKDPRIERNRLHAWMDILVLAVCARISGAEVWEDIAAFGHSKLEWLRRFVPLINGVPSHDCIAYVISRLEPKGFQSCLIRWAEGVREQTQGEVIAVDGKTARGTRDRVEGENRSVERRYFINSMAADAKLFACLRCAVTGASRTACTGGWMSCFEKR
ncbi:MAG: ISAs1 family transposase [Methylococcaceae bacterium]|nr:ISAs1 family transposase [Methylococcaceae bacterium]